MEHVNVFGDPKVVGPGVWWVIHSLAKQAIDQKSINKFTEFMDFLASNFSCKNCRKHIQAYMKDHPFNDLTNLMDNGRRIGMFKWAWLFHNAVNTRIGKPYVEWETAFDMFYNDIEVCSKNCEEADTDHKEQDIKELQVDKSKLAQGYFMSIGIPDTLKKNGVLADANLKPHESLVSYIPFNLDSF